jgi:hypothetical protein
MCGFNLAPRRIPTTHFSPPKNSVDKRDEMRFLFRLLGMKTAFAKQLKLHVSANGCMAIWARVSGFAGSVGTNF